MNLLTVSSSDMWIKVNTYTSGSLGPLRMVPHSPFTKLPSMLWKFWPAWMIILEKMFCLKQMLHTAGCLESSKILTVQVVLSLLTKLIMSEERRGSWGRAHPTESSTPVTKSRIRRHILQSESIKAHKNGKLMLLLISNSSNLSTYLQLLPVESLLLSTTVFLTEQIFSLHLYEVEKSHVDAVKSLYSHVTASFQRLTHLCFWPKNKDIFHVLIHFLVICVQKNLVLLPNTR